MHRPPSWSGSSSSSSGLSRFRSAPAGNWLESLLEEDESDPLKSNQNFTQLLSSSSTGPLHRQNSSPVDFLTDGCFGVPSSTFDSATNVSFSLNGETSGQVRGAESSMIDMDMENFLEDAVPRRVRAKRGFATHPRSIAERVRRTRISDRIRKLQELVPNMDKGVPCNGICIADGLCFGLIEINTGIEFLTEHRRPPYPSDQTNTADMLDEALEYVKTLQKQIQELSEHQSKCTCASKQ